MSSARSTITGTTLTVVLHGPEGGFGGLRGELVRALGTVGGDVPPAVFGVALRGRATLRQMYERLGAPRTKTTGGRHPARRRRPLLGAGSRAGQDAGRWQTPGSKQPHYLAVFVYVYALGGGEALRPGIVRISPQMG